jgi:hypothetical protein
MINQNGPKGKEKGVLQPVLEHRFSSRRVNEKESA